MGSSFHQHIWPLPESVKSFSHDKNPGSLSIFSGTIYKTPSTISSNAFHRQVRCGIAKDDLLRLLITPPWAFCFDVEQYYYRTGKWQRCPCSWPDTAFFSFVSHLFLRRTSASLLLPCNSNLVPSLLIPSTHPEIFLARIMVQNLRDIF
jgi:hypothetical protein